MTVTVFTGTKTDMAASAERKAEGSRVFRGQGILLSAEEFFEFI